MALPGLSSFYIVEAMHPRDGCTMRAALYARVSTDDQAVEGFSLDAQIKRLEAYCRVRGWEIAGEYRDEGFSGRNTRRPEYDRMMRESDTWDVLLVLKMDRIHRNSVNFTHMMDQLHDMGKEFNSVQEKFDTTTAMGRFVMDIMQRIAQLESEQIGERTYMGMREKAETLDKAEEGKRTMGFTPPFGYRLENGGLEEEPDELPIVSRMFSEYLGGSTMDEISWSLGREGILTRRGNPWNKRNMSTVLHNPVYAGYMRWEDVLIRHHARTAVSIEEFNRTQELMASKVRDPSKRNVFLIPTLDDFITES